MVDIIFWSVVAVFVVVLFVTFRQPACPDCGSRMWEKSMFGWGCRWCGCVFNPLSKEVFFRYD